MKLQDTFGLHLISVYDRVAAMQSADGRFRDPGEGFSIYGQYAGCYFAWLFTFSRPDNPYFRDAETLRRTEAGWDYYASTVLPSGQVPITTRDRYWFDSIDEWGFYYWLQTVDLIGEHLAPEKWAHWVECLHRIGKALVVYAEALAGSESFSADLTAHGIDNHTIWFVLAMHRYGLFSGDVALCERARGIMERIAGAQLQCGTWLEGGTAVVGYGEVAICAISLFALIANDSAARAAVQRNFDYVQATTFPNMQKNDCIDGRVGFSPQPFPYTAPTFCREPAGSAYLTRWIEKLAAASPDGKGLERSLQGIAVVSDIARMLPAEAQADHSTIPYSEERETNWPELQSVIRRQSRWTVTQCCLPPVTQAGRWIMQRQNLISIFHEETGLLVGGGHSISQPEFSCFNVLEDGKLWYLHEESQPREDGLRLRYGSIWCETEVGFTDEGGCRLRYSTNELTENDRVLVHLPLWIRGLSEIAVDASLYSLVEEGLNLTVPAGSVLQLGKATLRCTEKARLLYPVDGYSPYVLDKAEDPVNRRQAVLQIRLYPWQTSCEFNLQVETA